MNIFIIELNYINGRESVMPYLEAHHEYLDSYYAKGMVIMSGPTSDMNSGVLIATATDINDVTVMAKKDPFYINGVSEFKVIEFNATKHKITNFNK